MSLLKRLSNDLKKDKKKTLVMLSLAVAFIVVVAIRVFQGGDSLSTPVAVDVETAAILQIENDSSRNEEDEPSRFAPFLRASLPFEKINGNPFRAFYLDEEEAKLEPEKKLKEKKGEDLAREERSILSTFKVTCTVTGRNAFAVVNGKIVRLGEEYKGFVISEIEDGYVLFVGQIASQQIHVQY